MPAQVAGRILVPAAAMFEACATAGSILLDTPPAPAVVPLGTADALPPSAAAAAPGAVLVGVSIAEALAVPAAAAALVVVEAVVDLRAGSATLQSLGSSATLQSLGSSASGGGGGSRAAGPHGSSAQGRRSRAARPALKLHCGGQIARAATGAAAAPAAPLLVAQQQEPQQRVGGQVATEAAAPALPTLATSALRLLLLQLAKQDQQQRHHAAAVGAIWVPHSAQQNGFGLHPAAADATLHLSAAFRGPPAPSTAAPSSASAGPRQPALQIPVGLDALVAHSNRGHSCWAHSVAQPQPSSSSGSGSGDMALSYKLNGCQVAPRFQLSNLRLREVRQHPASAPAQPAAAAAAAAGAEQPADKEAEARDFMYVTEWQAAESYAAQQQQQPGARQAAADVATAAAGPVEAKAGWEVAGTSRLVVRHSLDGTLGRKQGKTPAATALTAATNALELLQRRLPQLPAGASLALAVRSAAAAPLPSPGPVAAAAGRAAAAAAGQAAVQALLKVAGMEYPGVQLSYCQLDAADVAPRAAHGPHPRPVGPTPGDAFGTAAGWGGCAVLRARLLRQPAPVPSTARHLMPVPRGSLANLRMVLQPKVAPGPGEIQASPLPHSQTKASCA